MYQQQLLDRFTRIDELLDRMLPVLERIESGGITVNMPKEFAAPKVITVPAGETAPAGPAGPTEIAVPRELIIATRRIEGLTSSVERLCDLLAKKQVGAVSAAPYPLAAHPTIYREGEEHIIMNYPRTGRVDLPVGKTKIDVKTRKVFLADGTVEEMYSPSTIKTCRSFLIYTDAEFDIRALLNGKLVYTSTVFPLWTRSKVLEFDELEITSSTPLMFYIAMSDTEDAMASIDPITNVASRNHVSTDPSTHFTTALATGEAENENITITSNKINLTDIAIMSRQNLHYRLALYTKPSFGVFEYIGNVDFDLPTEGFLLNGYYCMNVHNLDFDYIDIGSAYELHAQLVNLDAVSKSAGAAGAVQFTMIYGERL